MSWEGYVTYDDTEIINSARVEAYCRDKAWFSAAYGNTVLEDFEGYEYSNPVADEAPWVDPDVPASARFYGVYPLTFEGAPDSSRESPVKQSVNDGGVPGRVRHAVKSVTFSAVLLGEDDEACEYGLAWLRRVLLGKNCTDDTTINRSGGLTLGYLAAEPTYDPNIGEGPFDMWRRLYRGLYKVAFNAGPIVTAKRQFAACDGAMVAVTFGASVGNPFEHGLPKQILGNMPLGTYYTPESTTGTTAGPAIFVDPECGTNLFQPLFDPMCPALIEPPTVPSVPLSCRTVPVNWGRYTASIPAAEVPLWTQVMPLVTIHNAPGGNNEDMRDVRVRIYADPDDDGSIDEDPCRVVADFYITWLPVGGTLYIDSAREEVTIYDPTGRLRRADSLVVGTDGLPVQWDALSCGYAHLLALDGPNGTGPLLHAQVDLTLTPRYV